MCVCLGALGYCQPLGPVREHQPGIPGLQPRPRGLLRDRQGLQRKYGRPASSSLRVSFTLTAA